MMLPNAGSTLNDWLAYLEAAHPITIDMGLARVSAVKAAMDLQPAFPVVLIGGTNGKGSVAAMLSTILNRAGFKVGTYTSPHITDYNERVAINLVPASDALLIAGFVAVEEARARVGVSLSYFEVGTLAAMHCFMAQRVDIAVLEVGLGGRLDATNAFDADVSVVVSVDIDHQSFLGNDRESIGFEKAGIYRADKPAICADPNPPASLLAHAKAIGAKLAPVGQAYRYQRMDNQWSFHMGERSLHALPVPALRGGYQMGNAAAALAVLDVLHARLPVSLGAIKRGLLEVEWPGRFQVLPGRPVTVLDVGHNPHAARALSASLRQLAFAENRYAVFSMLSDKDLDAVVEILRDDIDHWFVAGLDGPRAQSGAVIAEKLAAHGLRNVRVFPKVEDAWHSALSHATENDRITVFGSFHTVAAVMAARSKSA
ncbi:bifunctional tetrahydrofolate synthase/dihydrofolate synthase [Craterilacuibacter sp.]|uniref:bifunctional tetrahydrofolate synthase/dihydrofolate synthase n=1 Tax=Craterilacuibacter sp. TaxID=2870909 RepID=UPI003F341D6B